MKNIKDILTTGKIKALAGSQSYIRGIEYADDGAVSSLKTSNTEISGKVQGQSLYSVRLFVDKDQVDWRCSCPVGREGNFCKHCVALGLTYIEGSGEDSGSDEKSLVVKDAISDEKRISDYLAKLDKSDLIKLIKTQANKDDTFHKNLLMVSLSESKTTDLSAVKGIINEAFRTGGFIDYNEAYAFTEGLENVCDMLKGMLSSHETASGIIELTEYALKKWEKTIEYIDDSDGGMGTVLDELHEIHLEACAVAKSDGITLAEKLFNITITSHWDMFSDAYNTYFEVFGEKGREAYRKLVKEKWDKSKNDKNSHKNYWLKNLMTKFAVEEHNFDAEMEILSSDLSYSNAYGRIAERCIEEKKPELALEWLKKGLSKFKDDSQLLVKLYELYWSMKQQEDSINTIWILFSFNLNLGNYQTLAKYSKLMGNWDEWRDKAINTVRSIIAANRKKYQGNKYTWFRVDNSLLVEIFLWEKDIEQAWKEFKDDGCSNDLKAKLCAKRQEDHPADVVEVYLDLAKQNVERTNNEAYLEAIKFIGLAKAQAHRGNQLQFFNTKILEMKRIFKAKRNFMKYLENAGF